MATDQVFDARAHCKSLPSCASATSFKQHKKCARRPSALRGNGTIILLADARRIIPAAEKKAEDVGRRMNVVGLDEGGNLIAF
jgi:hypothetical protein